MAKSEPPLVLLDEKTGRVMVLNGPESWFRPGADADWEPIKDGPTPLPNAVDVAENFAAVTGKEAESLASAAARQDLMMVSFTAAGAESIMTGRDLGDILEEHAQAEAACPSRPPSPPRKVRWGCPELC